MPEGPEIRRAADQIEHALCGRETTRVWFAFARLKPFEEKLSGRRITRIESRGKAIVTAFDNGWAIYSHNQLYGRWFIRASGRMPDTGRKLRIAIENRDHAALLYSASEIEVLPLDELEGHPFLSRLGPDILNDEPGAEILLERMRYAEFRNRQLAGLLLDQRFVAGLGNYLRAEILTLAGLHPSCRPAMCSERQLRRLARLIIQITRRSYRSGGITNPPSLVKRLKACGKVSREAHRFNTYGREGEPCYYCGETIRVSGAGGRKMYFCPGCQAPAAG